jgi:hypothetical protein
MVKNFQLLNLQTLPLKRYEPQHSDLPGSPRLKMSNTIYLIFMRVPSLVEKNRALEAKILLFRYSQVRKFYEIMSIVKLFFDLK